MTKSANSDIEFSCDDEVIKNSDIDFRKRYSKAILNSMHKQHVKGVMLSTQFKGGKKAMKMRFENILTTAKKRKGIAALYAFIVLILVSGLFVACNKESKPADNEELIDTLKTEVGEDGAVPMELENKINDDYADGTIIQDETLSSETPSEETNILYTNEWLGFSIRFSENWADLFEISENHVEYDSHGGAGITVYHKASRDSELPNITGVLFYIERWIGTWREEDPPIYDSDSAVVLQTDKYTYMLRIPGSVEYNESDEVTAIEYKLMSKQLDTVMSSVEGINTLYSIPSAEYQTEAEFLSSPEGMQLRQAAYGATKAMLSADADELAEYLIDPDNASRAIRNLTDVSNNLALLQFKFTLESIISDDEIWLSYEYALEGEDSFTYVSMVLRKVNSEWKVRDIGLEK